MKMSWLGQIEISASNVVLNLNFTPLKALKAALLPESTEDEGYAHSMKDLRTPEHWTSILGGKASPPQVLPRFCVEHRKRHARKLAEARASNCARCRVRLQTNYVECTLCTNCSARENMCLIC